MPCRTMEIHHPDDMNASASPATVDSGILSDPSITGQASIDSMVSTQGNLGADAVYSGMSLQCVEAMAREYIPVVGHIGFVPYRSTWIGGVRAVGKSAAEAIRVYEAAKAYQDAGAIGVEIEIVPARVCEEIGKRLDIILMSMGSGTGGTVQYLFATDILGTNTGHVPRHAKVYANLAKEEERLQRLRVEAFAALHQDVATGAYPEEKHILKIKDEEFEGFLAGLD